MDRALPRGDQVVFNDQSGPAGSTYTLTDSSLTRTGLIATITYATTETVVLNTNATSGDVVNVTNTVAAGTTGYTFAGLGCGTSYVLGVEAFDAAGNRSSRSTLTRTTSACVDTQPPTVPQGRQVTGSTQTGITMVWLASSDNVGVTGYRVYLNGALASTLSSLTYTYTGLSCGTTYSFRVAARDAAGNTSAPASVSASTAACAASGGKLKWAPPVLSSPITMFVSTPMYTA